MRAGAFDTYKLIKSLRASGFEEEQAEVLSGAFQEAWQSASEDLVTKTDFQGLRAEFQQFKQEMRADFQVLRSEFQEFKQEMRAEFQDLRHDVDQRITVLSGEFRELALSVDKKIEGYHAEVRLLKWMTGLMLAGIVTLILKAFFMP